MIERYKQATQFVDKSDKKIVEIGEFPNSILDHVYKTPSVNLVEKYGTNEWAKKIFYTWKTLFYQ
jgi:hypothetical protein